MLLITFHQWCPYTLNSRQEKLRFQIQKVLISGKLNLVSLTMVLMLMFLHN